MRLQRVRFSSSLFMDMLVEGNIIHAQVIKGLPVNARFCYSICNPYYVYIDFVFEHPNFRELTLGEEIPLYPEIVVKKLYDEVK